MSHLPCAVTADLNRHLRTLDAADARARAQDDARERFTVDVEPQPEGGWGYVLYKDGLMHDADPGPWETDNAALTAGERHADNAATSLATSDAEIALLSAAGY